MSVLLVEQRVFQEHKIYTQVCLTTRSICLVHLTSDFFKVMLATEHFPKYQRRRLHLLILEPRANYLTSGPQSPHL